MADVVKTTHFPGRYGGLPDGQHDLGARFTGLPPARIDRSGLGPAQGRPRGNRDDRRMHRAPLRGEQRPARKLLAFVPVPVIIARNHRWRGNRTRMDDQEVLQQAQGDGAANPMDALPMMHSTCPTPRR